MLIVGDCEVVSSGLGPNSVSVQDDLIVGFY